MSDKENRSDFLATFLNDICFYLDTTEATRFSALVARYRNDWVLAARELFCIDLTPAQASIFRAMQVDGIKISALTGFGFGTTTLQSMAVILYMITNENARVNMVASENLNIGKPIRDLWGVLIGLHPWLRAYFALEGNAFYAHSNCGGWRFDLLRVNDGLEAELINRQGHNALWIIDNADSVPDSAIDIAYFAANKQSRLLLMSTGCTRPSRLYDSQLNRCGEWTVFNFSFFRVA